MDSLRPGKPFSAILRKKLSPDRPLRPGASRFHIEPGGIYRLKRKNNPLGGFSATGAAGHFLTEEMALLTARLRLHLSLLVLGAALVAAPDTAAANFFSNAEKKPSLVVTDEPPPEVIYRPGSRDTAFSNQRGPSALALEDTNIQTLVTRKVDELNSDLRALQSTISAYQDRLRALQLRSDGEASEYYTLVAGINTELQAGTTPGNPILVERWNAAQNTLNRLSESAGYLSELSTEVSGEAARAAYLQDAVRATYGLSGAVKEDHRRLRQTEDDVNQSIVALNRLMTSVSDEMKRRDAYLRAERMNMQTMTLAIANGELYGQSLSNNLYKRAAEDGRAVYGDAAAPAGGIMPVSTGGFHSPAAAPANRRPLVVIRFDRANVNYEQAVYTAVGQALDKYPAARFDLVAVSPTEGNPAALALASTEARKNGEAVLRSLTQMGLPVERVRLNTASSREVRGSEVHIYVQ